MSTFTTVTPKRFTTEDYHRLIDLGFLTENDRVELIRGELIQMVAKGTSHTVCNTRCWRELTLLLQKRAIVRGEEPITLLPHSEPEPDLVIARYRPDDYLLTITVGWAGATKVIISFSPYIGSCPPYIKLGQERS